MAKFQFHSNRFEISKFQTCQWQKFKKSISQLPNNYGPKNIYSKGPKSVLQRGVELKRNEDEKEHLNVCVCLCAWVCVRV